jgi:hypothetical protein
MIDAPSRISTFLSSLALLSLLLSGCGKKDAKSTEGGNPLNAPADYLGAVSQAKKTAEKTVDAASIQQAINLFHAQEDRYPKDLDELVQQKYLPRLPEPPSGMRISYDPASGQVKILRH